MCSGWDQRSPRLTKRLPISPSFFLSWYSASHSSGSCFDVAGLRLLMLPAATFIRRGRPRYFLPVPLMSFRFRGDVFLSNELSVSFLKSFSSCWRAAMLRRRPTIIRQALSPCSRSYCSRWTWRCPWFLTASQMMFAVCLLKVTFCHDSAVSLAQGHHAVQGHRA